MSLKKSRSSMSSTYIVRADNFPTIGVLTAPEIRYAVSIQEDVVYEISKSLIISRIAGNNIVSPYIVIRTVDPRIASVIHVEVLIFSEVSGSTAFEDDSGCGSFLGASLSGVRSSFFKSSITITCYWDFQFNHLQYWRI